MRVRMRGDVRILTGMLLCALFALVPAAAKAANLYFSPSSGTYAQNENFTVSILVNTGEATINAVSGTITFPTEYLGVLALSTVNSLVNLWVQTPSFSNSGAVGNIRFEGILLNPGYSGTQGKILDLVLRNKKTGSAGLVFNEFAVLANDGRGTNIGALPGSALFTFAKSSQPSQSSDTSGLNKRVQEIEKRVKALTESPQGAPVVVVQRPETEGLLGLWEILPAWVKGGVLLLIGIATLILLLALICFGVIAGVWFWNSFWHNRFRIRRRVRAAWAAIEKYARKILVFLGLAERELTGDIAYGIREMEREFQSAAQTPPLKALITNYWSALRRIAKRFFVRNEIEQAVTSEEREAPATIDEEEEDVK